MRALRVACIRSAALAAAFAITACSSWGGKTESVQDEIFKEQRKHGSIFGTEGGLNLLGSNRTKGEQDGTGLGVNGFLWRASLDTLSFMPVVSADPFGGVILTDWYSPADTPNERFKVNLYILDRQLRADGVRVSVFRQLRNGATWQDAGVSADTGARLEDAILTRARQLRISQTAQK